MLFLINNYKSIIKSSKSVENLIFHHELFGNLDNFLVSIMFFVCDIIAECTS